MTHHLSRARWVGWLACLAFAGCPGGKGCGGGSSVDTPDTADPTATTVRVGLRAPALGAGLELALNATARFEASVVDDAGALTGVTTTLQWTTGRGRAVFLPAGTSAPWQTDALTVDVRGDRAGEERVTVSLVDVDTGDVIAEDTLAFDIVGPGDAPSDCFDGTRFFVRSGFVDPTTVMVDPAAGTRTTIAYDVYGRLSADGNWFAYSASEWVPSGEPAQRAIWIVRCDGTGSRQLTSGYYDAAPQFSPDGDTVYFLRSSLDEDPLFPGEDRPGSIELASVDVASGVSGYLTDLNASAEAAGLFVVSPDGTRIAFEHHVRSIHVGSGATYDYVFDLVTMPAGGGPLTSLTALGTYPPLQGLDWSPDGRDIVYSWNADNQEPPMGTAGLYRISPAGGAGGLIFADPSEESLPPGNPRYYAGGTRIAWDGQDYGVPNIEVWSCDANGGDVQRITTDDGPDVLIDVWDPTPVE